MSQRAKRASRSIPPFVQVRKEKPAPGAKPGTGRVIGYRGWCSVAGRKRYGPMRRDALKAQEDALAMRDADDKGPRQLVTLERAHESFLKDLAGVRQPGTLAFYTGQFNAVCRWIRPELRLHQITPSVLQAMIVDARREYSARTLSHYRRYLHRLIEWCRKPQRAWWVGDNPVNLASWPEARANRPDVLTEPELAAHLAKAADSPHYPLLVFMAYTGLRRAEVARLTAADVDLERGTFWVRGKVLDEAAPITPQIRTAIAQLVAGAYRDGHLVEGKNETRRVQRIDRIFRSWAEQTGDRRCHPHALRHTLATNLIRRGVTAGTVQRVLRHASYTTTQRYVNLVADDVHTAVGQLRYTVEKGAEKPQG